MKETSTCFLMNPFKTTNSCISQSFLLGYSYYESVTAVVLTLNTALLTFFKWTSNQADSKISVEDLGKLLSFNQLWCIYTSYLKQGGIVKQIKKVCNMSQPSGLFWSFSLDLNTSTRVYCTPVTYVPEPDITKPSLVVNYSVNSSYSYNRSYSKVEDHISGQSLSNLGTVFLNNLTYSASLPHVEHISRHSFVTELCKINVDVYQTSSPSESSKKIGGLIYISRL